MIKYLNIKPSFYILFKDNRIIEYNFFSLMSDSIDPQQVKAVGSNKEELEQLNSNDTLTESSDRGKLKRLKKTYNTRLGEYADDNHWQSLSDKVKTIWKQRVTQLANEIKELEEQISSQEVSTSDTNSQNIELVFLSEDDTKTLVLDDNSILNEFLKSTFQLTNFEDPTNLKSRFIDIRYGEEEYYDDKLYGSPRVSCKFTDSMKNEHEITLVFEAEVDFDDTTRTTPKHFPALKNLTNITQIINKVTWVEAWVDGNQVDNISPENISLLDQIKTL